MEINFFSSDWGDCVENGVATLRCIPIVLGNIINALLVLAAVVALIFIIYSGIKYISSQGDPQAIDSARKTLTWAIIGLVFIVLSFAILQFVINLTGAKF